MSGVEAGSGLPFPATQRVSRRRHPLTSTTTLPREMLRTMSEGNVEIVRRAWEAWEQEDWEPLYALDHPDIVWDASALRGPITGVYHGHDGVRRYFREWLESFEARDARAEKFIAAGDDVSWAYD